MPKSIEYWLALTQVPRLAVVKKLALVEEFGLAGLFSQTTDQLVKLGLTDKQQVKIVQANFSATIQLINRCTQLGIGLIAYDDVNYPPLLKTLYDPPLVLYSLGDPSVLSQPQVAIVGSRFASASGKSHARQLAADLNKHGWLVTSGLAIGIDGAAHQGALDCQAKTIAVVATGLDITYPAHHKLLVTKIIENGGCVVSEYPPSTPPRAGQFPKRNRLISGLSQGVVVVEAALKSGSLITAYAALEQNREVFAVPGPINAAHSKGCHHLIKQGAKLVEGVDDILEELDQNFRLKRDEKESEYLQKSDVQDLLIDPLLDTVGYEITSVDIVVSRSKLPIDVVLTRLTLLELRGLVSAVPGGYLRKDGG